MPEIESQTNCPAWKLWVREVAEVWRDGWSRLYPRLWIILAACIIGMVLVLVISDADVSLQQMARVDGSPAADAVARFLSRYSDVIFGVPVSVLIWAIGAMRDSVRWRKLALACLMATLMAGLITDIFRFGTGRPRPYAAGPNTVVADGFYGPNWSAQFQSFPSGHATTSSATAASLAGAVPVLAIPGAVYAVSVSWSRMQLDKHHPIDVTVGALIGVVCGLCFAGAVPGAAICLRERKKESAK